MISQVCDIVLLLPFGLLADRFGPTRILRFVLAALAAALLLTGFADLTGAIKFGAPVGGAAGEVPIHLGLEALGGGAGAGPRLYLRGSCPPLQHRRDAGRHSGEQAEDAAPQELIPAACTAGTATTAAAIPKTRAALRAVLIPRFRRLAVCDQIRCWFQA